jgi:Spy/CpxP family protein refolding chaperone
MFYVRLSALLVGLFVLTGGLPGQDKPTKDDPKETKKDEPTGKVKGQLPQGWGKLGLTDEQKQKVYKINAKYGEQIAKLEAQIRELKDKMAKERLEVLTPEQKKTLREMKSKSGG